LSPDVEKQSWTSLSDIKTHNFLKEQHLGLGNFLKEKILGAHEEEVMMRITDIII
jgi:hypothetical protein